MIKNVKTMSKELERSLDPFRTTEEVSKIEECCMKFLKDGEKQIEKLKGIILDENRNVIPTKEYFLKF